MRMHSFGTAQICGRVGDAAGHNFASVLPLEVGIKARIS